MALTEYRYLFAIGTIFSLLDAYNIGANDVANSWATSVSSKSLTMRQAVLGAAVFEFLGAVTVGARTADTIKNGIIPLKAFQGNPGLQILAFTCAITVSATWLMFCTYMSFPVSTTYSIVAAVAGVGVALAGADEVHWGWNNGKGLGAIFAGLGIAPAISAGFAAALYLLIKFVVLMRKDPVRWSIFTGPFFFFTAAAVCTMSIIYKGAPSLGLNKKSDSTTAAAIVGTAAVIAALSALFWIPYVWVKVIRKDYTVRWYHFFMGPLLWNRTPPMDADEHENFVPDYRIDDRSGSIPENGNTAASIGSETAGSPHDEEKVTPLPETKRTSTSGGPKIILKEDNSRYHSILASQFEQLDKHQLDPEYPWYSPKNLWTSIRYRAVPTFIKTFTYCSEYDIHAAQAAAGTREGRHMQSVYENAKQFPNEVEHSYSFIQVLTACTASFAHGANDLANAVGPWSVITQVYLSGNPASSKAPVPIWLLVVGAIVLVLGLATYGYNIMRVLGNKLTYHSPSRGCSMELGAAITVILASQYGLPVSTTMCITGATVGVGLCNGNLHAVNWKGVAWIVCGWLLTLAVAGTLAGCLMGIIINAPRPN